MEGGATAGGPGMLCPPLAPLPRGCVSPLLLLPEWDKDVLSPGSSEAGGGEAALGCAGLARPEVLRTGAGVW